MVRGAFYDKNGVKKGAWSKEEDDKLRAYIARYGHWNWRELPKFAGLSRCGKSCRLRWINYLRPDLKHGGFTPEEDRLITDLRQQLGNKWSTIASKISGRTDNEIKNYWHSHLKKRVTTEQRTPAGQSQSSNKSSPPTSSCSSDLQNSGSQSQCQTSQVLKETLKILESSPLSPPETSSYASGGESSAAAVGRWENCTIDGDSNSGGCCHYDDGGDFWTEPFVVESSISNGGGNGSSCAGDLPFWWMGGEYMTWPDDFLLDNDEVDGLMYGLH